MMSFLDDTNLKKKINKLKHKYMCTQLELFKY